MKSLRCIVVDDEPLAVRMIEILDIQMPDLSGMELSRMIPQGTRIIFTTAFKQYAFESYEVSAAARDSIFVKSDGGLHKVFLGDILYFEGMKDYVKIHLSDGQSLITHITVKSLEDMLPSDRFMRVHRSYIVALDRIDSVSVGGDISIGDAFIHVSDSCRSAFDSWLSAHSLLSGNRI